MKLNKKTANKLWVVVPAYNEEKLITSCLVALREQQNKEFTLLIVNNNSSDSTTSVIRKFQKQNPTFDIRIISEKQKGTGAACDTGFRYAIKHGAKYIARTDSDALASKDWTLRIQKHFDNGKKFIGGRLRCRTDEPNVTIVDRFKARIGIFFAEQVAKTWHRGPQYKYRMFMAPGLNMAITSEIYLKSGGFPRTSIDVADEDLELHLKVRRILDKDFAIFDPHLYVYGSPRRAKAYGYINILFWYWNKKFRGDVVDIR
jgi:glycosyltransferase involved in cell wall biosynthesis